MAAATCDNSPYWALHEQNIFFKTSYPTKSETVEHSSVSTASLFCDLKDEYGNRRIFALREMSAQKGYHKDQWKAQ
jgi:hypothetical protein